MKLCELEQHCGECDIMGLCAPPFSELCLCADSRFSSLTEKQYIELAEQVCIENTPDYEDGEAFCEALNTMIANEVYKKMEEMKDEK